MGAIEGVGFPVPVAPPHDVPIAVAVEIQVATGFGQAEVAGLIII